MKQLISWLLLLLFLALPVRAAEQNSNESEKYKQDSISGWIAETRDGEFEVGTDPIEKHSGKRSGYIRSCVKEPKQFGNLMQSFVPQDFLGKRVRMTLFVKSKVTRGSANCWARVDGPWNDKEHGIKVGSFDNMADRPIQGTTDWTSYSIVIDVPEDSTNLWFGCMLNGNGQVWLDDAAFEVVSKETVPLTGIHANKKNRPTNIGFEE